MLMKQCEYWYEKEIYGGPIPSWGIGQITRLMKDWDRIVEYRRDRLDVIKEYNPKLIKSNSLRLPTALPIKVSVDNIEKLKEKGYEINLLHYPLKKNSLELVLPLPLHHQFPIFNLKEILNIIFI